MNIKRELFKQINKTVLKSSAFLLIIAIISLPEINFAFAPNQPVFGTEIKSQDETFEKKFREGRDLIDKEEWAKAAEKFNEVVSKYPTNKSTDAALYWLAFCYKKQKRFIETNVTLDRILKEFPASSWADDARVMKNEMPAVSAVPAVPFIPAVPAVSDLSNIPDLPNLPDQPNIINKPLSIDREDEIKIAAFKSLLSADTKRAIQAMGDVLTPDSKASEIFKQLVLRTLRNPFLFEQPGANISASGTKDQLITLLRETLIKSFQKEPNIKIRREIIYTLAGLNDDRSINYLAQLYTSESNQENKKTIISSLSQLVGGWTKANEKVVDVFTRLYDGETDEQFKMVIIRIFGDSKQNNAYKKLFEIAKNDKSDKLKLQAIYALRTSNDPEVLKFLEELIK